MNCCDYKFAAIFSKHSGTGPVFSQRIFRVP